MAVAFFPLVCEGKAIHVRMGLLIELGIVSENLDLFRKRRYKVCTIVDGRVFTEFCEAVKGEAVTVTKENVAGIEALCVEFGFHELDDAIGESRARRIPGSARDEGEDTRERQGD